MGPRITGFAPVAEEGARLLILGTMPSVRSLEDAFYYAHPRNAFWPIMARVLEETPAGDAEGKRSLLIRHHVALWDVCRSCVRPGSLDSGIRDMEPNDVRGLLARLPGIGKVLFNGAAAERLYFAHIGSLPDGVVHQRMPSTSPAYTLSFEKKLAAWREGMEGYHD